MACCTLRASNTMSAKPRFVTTPSRSLFCSSTFSSSSVNLVYGGTGSGNIDASTADTLRTALEKVGVTVNPTLWDFYTTGAGKDYSRNTAGTVATASEVTAEVPWDVYTDEVKDSGTSSDGQTTSSSSDSTTSQGGE